MEFNERFIIVRNHPVQSTVNQKQKQKLKFSKQLLLDGMERKIGQKLSNHQFIEHFLLSCKTVNSFQKRLHCLSHDYWHLYATIIFHFVIKSTETNSFSVVFRSPCTFVNFFFLISWFSFFFFAICSYLQKCKSVTRTSHINILS